MRAVSHDTYELTIADIVDETHDTKTLVLENRGERFAFTAGQYLTVRLPGFEPAEGKSYSISSTPDSETISLTIKEMGAFSKALLAHKVGDTLTTSAPYGFFYPEPEEENNLAFVAGGIGITPCMSIIESLLTHGYTQPITLFYANKTIADIVFKNRLDALMRTYPHFHVTYFITREMGTDSTYVYSRMNAEHIHNSLSEPLTTDFFICGSIDFTKSLWKALKESGIPQNRLYTEGFF